MVRQIIDTQLGVIGNVLKFEDSVKGYKLVTETGVVNVEDYIVGRDIKRIDAITEVQAEMDSEMKFVCASDTASLFEDGKFYVWTSGYGLFNVNNTIGAWIVNGEIQIRHLKFETKNQVVIKFDCLNSYTYELTDKGLWLLAKYMGVSKCL